jgi:serine protease Do
MSHVFSLLLLSLAPNPAGPPPGLDAAALVWAKADAGTSQGTAVLLDRRERLLVTAWHVVRGAKELHVLFPLYENQKLLTEPLPYQERFKRGQTARARVVAADPKRDLAVLQLDSVPDEVREVTLAAIAPEPDDAVYFVGNPQAKNVLWDRAIGKACGVAAKTWAFSTGQEVSVIVLEVDTARGLGSGFSGGPAVNAAAELVGVTIAAQEANSPRVYCADAGAVRRQLAESYSTLALTAIRDGDDPAACSLSARARRLTPDDGAAACLETVANWLEGAARSPAGVALRYVRRVVRAPTRGVHP